MRKLIKISIMLFISVGFLVGCSDADSNNKAISYDIPSGWVEMETNEKGCFLIGKENNEDSYIAVFVDDINSDDVTKYDDIGEFEKNMKWAGNEEGVETQAKECEKRKVDGKDAFFAHEKYSQISDGKMYHYFDYEIFTEKNSIIISMESSSLSDVKSFDEFVDSIVIN